MKNNLLLLSFILLLTSCFNRKINNKHLDTPPGAVEMTNNCYLDYHEIRTLDYQEFLHWTQQVYSAESEEYKKILPDTNVWKTAKYYNAPYASLYLTHPSFRDYPVVGVTYEQAQAFCKWRADRVFEFTLIKLGVLPGKRNLNKDSCFTIERYFNGYYGKPFPNPYLYYYPEYTLLDTATYVKALTFADSLNQELLKHCRHKKLETQLLQIWCKDKIIDGKTWEATRQVYNCYSRKGLFIENLKGNVRELSSDKNITLGGSFVDSCKTVMETNFYPYEGANCYTGFRCVCKYKKWEK